MIAASPGRSPTDDQTAEADRLIALLPSRPAPTDSNSAPKVSQGEAPLNRPPSTVSVMVIAIYIGVMMLSQWIASGRLHEAPAEIAASPTPATTLGETLPSAPDGAPASKSTQ
jgi:hypothetical protein